MPQDELRSGFAIDKILDYVQYAYDNFDVLHDGQKHYHNDGEIYICRIGDYLKLGKPGVHKGTGFAFVKPSGKSASVQIDANIAYRFINGVLYVRNIEHNGNKIQYSDDPTELTKDYLFHSYLDCKDAYILTMDELVRVKEMSTAMSLELYLQSYIKTRKSYR